MIVKKIIYNNGKNEGYFIETRKGYVPVVIKTGESLKLSRIKDSKEVELSEIDLKLREVKRHDEYFG